MYDYLVYKFYLYRQMKILVRKYKIESGIAFLQVKDKSNLLKTPNGLFFF